MSIQPTLENLNWHIPLDSIEAALDAALPAPQHSDARGLFTLREAMREATLGGGKRLRARLVLEAAFVVNSLSTQDAAVANAAVALEMIHAYSLVHDDLPAMDNAETRRGQPTSHIRFGEAAAILAGDGLLTLAFETLARDAENPSQTLRAILLLAQAAGESGMVGGQAVDVDWGNAEYSPKANELLNMHAMKTGALIRASCEIGALLGGGSETQIAALRDYGTHLGRAFQITDDLLDAVGDPQHTGKASSDAANGKITATAVFGIEGALHKAHQSGEAALRSLELFDERATTLRDLITFIINRNH